MPSIERAVLSSCSHRFLGDLIREVRAICGVSRFDLLVLRDRDIRDIPGILPRSTFGGFAGSVPSSTDVLSDERHLDAIEAWIAETFRRTNAPYGRNQKQWNKISALATFFPDVTARPGKTDPRAGVADGEATPQERAIRAIVNTVRLALRLKNNHHLIAESVSGRSPAIVEIVCGTVLDLCKCKYCRDVRRGVSDRAMISTREFKLRLLCDAMAEVVRRVNKAEGKKDRHWAVALELEPGPVYVLNDESAIDCLFKWLPEYDSNPENSHESLNLAQHVGLNLDIAHMKIAGVSADVLAQYKDRIVHAHLCDHPGMHTRDQIVGVWSPVEQVEGEDYDYVRLLWEVAQDLKKHEWPPARLPWYRFLRDALPSHRRREGRPTGLPFSGTVALELEGCSRIAWIHRSLIAMRHMFKVVDRIHGRVDVPQRPA